MSSEVWQWIKDAGERSGYYANAGSRVKVEHGAALISYLVMDDGIGLYLQVYEPLYLAVGHTVSWRLIEQAICDPLQLTEDWVREKMVERLRRMEVDDAGR